MLKKESQDALKDAKEELEAAREVARLKLHLLSMDARRTWDELEGKIQELQGKLGERGEKATEVSAVAARDLARSIRKFVEKHV
jgi:hypothetical protein